jgi:hypothetical protein
LALILECHDQNLFSFVLQNHSKILFHLFQHIKPSFDNYTLMEGLFG